MFKLIIFKTKIIKVKRFNLKINNNKKLFLLTLRKQIIKKTYNYVKLIYLYLKIKIKILFYLNLKHL